MPRPLVATIHHSALQHNLRIAMQTAAQASNAARTWAVVKANAYGHGLARAMRAFAQADGLGLIEVDGAVRLRELGWRKPILLLEGFFSAEDVPLLVQHHIETAIHCDEQIAMLAAAPPGAQIVVHLKINTGMNRLGFAPARAAEVHARLSAMPCVSRIVLMTHFANADAPDNRAMPLDEQLHRFYEATAGLAGERSLSNSAAVLTRPDAAADWIRPGIMLYGATPGGRTAKEFGLQPAMSLTSELIGIQELRAGDPVGYGSHFRAPQASRIGVVAIGYADGYPRHAPTGTPVLVDGIRTQVVGRVSMDMITVDLTPLPQARVGSPVLLWGPGLPIDEVAQAAGTIGYELMCAVAPRVEVRED